MRIDAGAVAAIAGAGGGIGLECDVTSAAADETAMARSLEAHGPASILIDAVGGAPAKKIVGRNGPMPPCIHAPAFVQDQGLSDSTRLFRDP